MKRNPALRELSVDHHHSLVHAHRLITASEDPVAITAVVGEFLRFWEAEVRRHFREEEEILLPVAASFDPSLAREPLVSRMLADHVEIRSLVMQMKEVDLTTCLSLARRLGTLLEAHVRLEERVVFPLLETRVPPEGLAQIKALLALDREAPDGPALSAASCEIRSRSDVNR